MTGRFGRSAGALAALGDVLVPPRCVGCAVAGSWFCSACRGDCDPVAVRLSPRLHVRGAGVHAGALRDAVHRLKYRDERGLAHELGSLVASLVAADLARGTCWDAIVPVSAHRARAAARGYDQAVLVAAAAARACGVPLRAALRRIRAGSPQVALGRSARAANLRGAFLAEAGALRGLGVALVDDVVTTGSTLQAAAAAARAAGARRVGAYVVAVDA